jgi:hypothetical protein
MITGYVRFVKQLLLPIQHIQNRLTVGDPTKLSLAPISKQTMTDFSQVFHMNSNRDKICQSNLNRIILRIK